MKKLLAGEPGGHEELVLGEEVIDKLLFHAPGLEGEWKTSVESKSLLQSVKSLFQAVFF